MYLCLMYIKMISQLFKVRHFLLAKSILVKISGRRIGGNYTPMIGLSLNSNGQLEGNAIQFLTSPNVSNSQPWEVGTLHKYDAYSRTLFDTPSEMATKLR